MLVFPFDIQKSLKTLKFKCWSGSEVWKIFRKPSKHLRVKISRDYFPHENPLRNEYLCVLHPLPLFLRLTCFCRSVFTVGLRLINRER